MVLLENITNILSTNYDIAMLSSDTFSIEHVYNKSNKFKIFISIFQSSEFGQWFSLNYIVGELSYFNKGTVLKKLHKSLLGGLIESQDGYSVLRHIIPFSNLTSDVLLVSIKFFASTIFSLQNELLSSESITNNLNDISVNILNDALGSINEDYF